MNIGNTMKHLLFGFIFCISSSSFSAGIYNDFLHFAKFTSHYYTQGSSLCDGGQYKTYCYRSESVTTTGPFFAYVPVDEYPALLNGTSCRIKMELTTTVVSSGMWGWGLQPSFSDFTQSTYGHTTDFTTTRAENCAIALSNLGLTYGITTNSRMTQGATSPSAVNNTSAAQICIDIEANNIRLPRTCQSSTGNVNPTPPDITTCDISIPAELQHGVLSKQNITNSIATTSGVIQCNKNSTINISLLNSDGKNTIKVGDDLQSEIVFCLDNSCSSESKVILASSVEKNKQHSLSFSSRLKMLNATVTPGDKEGNVIINISYI